MRADAQRYLKRLVSCDSVTSHGKAALLRHESAVFTSGLGNVAARRGAQLVWSLSVAEASCARFLVPTGFVEDFMGKPQKRLL